MKRVNHIVMDGNWTCGDHSVVYRNVELEFYMPETYIKKQSNSLLFICDNSRLVLYSVSEFHSSYCGDW